MKKINLFILSSLLLTTLLSQAKDGEQTSLAQASERVRNTTKGKILSAKTMKKNEKIMHQIQVLTPNGRVKMIRVPKDIDNQKKSSEKRRNQHRNTPRQSYRLNSHPRTSSSQSRIKNNRSAARENSEKNKRIR